MYASRGKAAPLPEPVIGRIAVVGVCAAGKTVLVRALCARGYDARSCAQEHSFVPDMWQRLSRPEVLVYLGATLETIQNRRRIDFGWAYLQEQRRRLEHAERHCHIHIATDALIEAEVLEQVIRHLDALGLKPAKESA